MKVLIPAAAFLIVILLSACILIRLPSQKENRRSIVKASGIFAAIAIPVVLLYCVLLPIISTCEAAPSVLSMAVLAASSYSGFVGSKFFSGQALRKFAFRLAVLTALVFAAETFLFNLKSISLHNEQLTADFSLAGTDTPDTVQLNGSSAVFTGDGSITFTVSSETLDAVTLQFQGNDPWITCSADIMDGNFSQKFVRVGEKLVSGSGTAEFSFHTYKELDKVRITLSDVANEGVTITSCVFRTVLPFRFSNVRFFFLWAVLGGVCAVVTFGLHRITYDKNSEIHRLCICAVTGVCMLSVLSFLDPSQGMIDCETVNMRYTDPFVQMFDAFHNGRVSLDIAPSQELLEMENPYDRSLRSAQNVSSAWDRAYYDGKYYSYYGAAPVLVFYFPMYWLTGRLPNLNMTTVFFGVLTILCLCGTIVAFTRRFLPKANLVLLLLTMAAACCSSGNLYIAAGSSFYGIPGLSGSCFLLLCCWTGLEAASSGIPLRRYILFAVSGLAFALCVASRPTRALSALLLAPVFLGILFRREYKVRTKIASASAFLAPVLLGGGCIMAYNYARFDSPLEFGAVYQLTVSDVHANVMHLSSLPYAIIQYFFQPFEMTSAFPYLSCSSVSLNGYGQYIYFGDSHGAMLYPLIFTGVAVLPFLFWYSRKTSGAGFLYDDTRIKHCTYLLMLILAVVIAWFDFCMAGVIYSYVGDILPILSLLAAWVILDAGQKLGTVSPSASAISTCAFSVVCVLTIIVSFLELLPLYEIGWYITFPDFTASLEDLICFWN